MIMLLKSLKFRVIFGGIELIFEKKREDFGSIWKFLKV
jgi:hypothetical protein